jgi:hypothetical protein
MRFLARGANVQYSWFDSHKTDLAGLAVLVAFVLLIALFVKLARE